MDALRATRLVRIGSRDPVGLHLRPAQLFVQIANRFQADIEVIRDSLRVDGKSIFHMMTLAAEPGTELAIEAIGVDAVEATEALAQFVENDFDSEVLARMTSPGSPPPTDAG